jgi:co-chaperonin GroES (HSP10)
LDREENAMKLDPLEDGVVIERVEAEGKTSGALMANTKKS